MKINQFNLKIILVLVFGLLIGLVFIFDLEKYATLEYLQAKQTDFKELYQNNTLLVVSGVFSLYLIVATFSLPFATILTLLSGTLFGLLVGALIVSFASSIGASFAFLISRFLIKETIQKKYSNQLKKINQGFDREGSFYLFAIRLTPIFPFFIVNTVIALLPIRLWTFYWISQVAMLPATIIYVFAGEKLGNITSISDIASPSLLIALSLLGLFPLLVKIIFSKIKKRNYEG